MNDYGRFCERLFRQNEFSIKLGLERMRVALDAEGSPDRAYRTILIAGTNGKGSVASLMHAALVDAGLRVGLYTSPHLVDVRERVRIDGVPMSRDGFQRLGERLLGSWSDGLPEPQRLTYFELVTLMATVAFRDAAVDLALFEVGLGGRLDATNALEPEMTVICPVALDHREYLGDTIGAVFGEKAATLRPGRPAVVALPDGWDALHTDTACKPFAAAPLSIEERDFGLDDNGVWVGDESVPMGRLALVGTHQRRNAALAVAALRRVPELRDSSLQALADGAGRARWPGRWQRVNLSGRELILDGAHNPHAANALAQLVADEGLEPAPSLLFACSRGKDLDAVVAALLPVVGAVVLCPLANPRALPPETVAAAFTAQGRVPTICRDVAAAIDRVGSPDRPALVAGSLYLVGEVLAAAGFCPEDLEIIGPPGPF